jgi:transposase
LDGWWDDVPIEHFPLVRRGLLRLIGVHHDKEAELKLYVGVDWAEQRHEVAVLDEEGTMLRRAKVSDDLAGVARFHELVAEHAEEAGDVHIGIETDRGLFVGALVSAGYHVHAVNPFSVARYRDRFSSSKAKSDPGDARVLGDMVRTDAHLHREVAADSDLAGAVQILARSHQALIWSRRHHTNAMRARLREYYPAAVSIFGADLHDPDAVAVLQLAPTPALGRRLTVAKIAAALRRGGRRRYVEVRARLIHEALRVPQLEAPQLIVEAFAIAMRAELAVVAEMNRQVEAVEAELAEHFEMHPDAKVVLSQPGLGTVLGARVLAEFGDSPNRYANAKSRRNYAGTSPVTKASGTKRYVFARRARNARLADATYLWAFAAISASPGAREYYNRHRRAGATHNQALRALSNRLVGILHGCLSSKTLYDERIAWVRQLDAVGERPAASEKLIA